MNIEKVLMELESQDVIFPREAFEFTTANRDLMIPELVKILAHTLENYEAFLEQPNYMGHIYAMYLLAQFREKSAYPLIIELSSLPDEIPDELMGDTVTEDLPRILAGVSCGDDHLIRRLAENEDVNEYVRSSALGALVTLVAAGEKSRDELVDYFQSLFRTKLSREPSVVWETLVSYCLDLYPGEVYEDIKQCYSDDLIEPFFVSMEDVEASLAMGKEAVLEDLKKNRHYTLITDAIKDMEEWACFQPPKPSPVPTIDAPKPPPLHIESTTKPLPVQIRTKKIGRNQPCPCGSGKKYKKCCGRQ